MGSPVKDTVENANGERVTAVVCEAVPPARCRRGRRGQRRAGVDCDGRNAATQLVEHNGGATVSAGDAFASGLREKPVNTTHVRRRAKPVGSITKVVTDVSLEDLRAKRNGTGFDSAADGEKTIEEVSRLLLMYSSWQQRHQQGGKNNHNRKQPSAQNIINGSITFGEETKNVDMTGVPVPKVTVGLAGGEQKRAQPHGPTKSFDTISDLRSHVISLVQSGRLPGDSLEVLKVMLRHPPRGGKLDICRPARQEKPFSVNAPSVQRANVAQRKNRDQLSQELCSMGTAFFGYPQPPLFGGPAGMFSTYGGYQTHMGQEHSNVDGFNLCAIPGTDGVYPTGSGPDPFIFGDQQEQAPWMYDLEGDAFACYDAFVPMYGVVGQDAVWGLKNDVDTSDDGDDVTGMLHDIREAAQIGLTPRELRLGGFDGDGNLPFPFAGAAYGAQEPNNSSISNATSTPVPSVTISHSEREKLRSLQQAFLAHVRQTSSPHCKSPGVSPPGTWCALVGGNGPWGARTQDGSQDVGEEEEDSFWYPPNRTLFSYHTDFSEAMDDKGAPGSTVCGVTAKAIASMTNSPRGGRGPDGLLRDAHLSTIFLGTEGETTEELLCQWTPVDDGSKMGPSDEATPTCVPSTRFCETAGSGVAAGLSASNFCATLSPVQVTLQKGQAVGYLHLPLTPAGSGLSTHASLSPTGVTPVGSEEVNATPKLSDCVRHHRSSFTPQDLSVSAAYFI
ncbi:hypothetical protein, conserved [Trypanosoma brucei gambiense DAL972]|uniref:Uncharacterized protein n=1 Tax=Trypanosoma brucei gambiense (strain MHOM/CI/86/DAL972) TaxID=679716 RepID=D0A9I9_TRYB9|nr:hypothetical protein, conserved [Trypanosoma brucei gambiense DAL972]CBH18340.1 hypothetical protein, conserved [Trypanosoma brucei gambiense DAL972]|eukprot:XP_011780604.1 hypothetical protein, conserved [Trypanosoma brucei gambiense DAL972]